MSWSLSFAVLAFAFLAAAQDKPTRKSDKAENYTGKVCVARIGNASATSLFIDRLTERLTKDLRDAKFDAVTMDSSTTLRRPLQMTSANADEMKEKACDFLLLTQVSVPKSEPTTTRLPEISIGDARPSLDASDSIIHGPVHRDNLKVEFALFRTGRFEPMIAADLLAEPSGHVSDSMMPAMDRVASRIAHDLKKKK